MDCGPGYLRMIAKHYGQTYSVQSLLEKSFITRVGGHGRDQRGYGGNRFLYDRGTDHGGRVDERVPLVLRHDERDEEQKEYLLVYIWISIIKIK